jgi:hypothetical protein
MRDVQMSALTNDGALPTRTSAIAQVAWAMLKVDGALSTQSLTALVGLVVYTGLFALIAARRFKWE